MWRKALVAAPLAASLVMLVSAQAWAAGPISGVSGTDSPNHFFWYLSRTSAMLAYILLFINFVLGAGMKTRFMDKLTARWLSFDLHQFTALLSISLIGLHVFALLGDQYLSPTLSNLLIPFSGSYRPVWTALGIISFYLLIIIMLSSYWRRWIGRQVWRGIHVISFILFYVILYHGLRSGSDSSTLWAQIIYLGTGTAAAFLFLWRILLAGRYPSGNSTRITPRQSPGDAIK